MLEVRVPETYPQEREYVLSVLLGEFLGLEYALKREPRRDWRMSMTGNSALTVADRLFQTPAEHWLTARSLPERPLKRWTPSADSIEAATVAREVPVIYGVDSAESPFFSVSGDQISLGLDIFGSAFFMLTRYEEVVKGDRDRHDRFPAKASLAFSEGFLERPIVNEYLEILWACMRRLWPELRRRDRRFTVLPSHDVDMPFEHAFASPTRLIRSCVGDLAVRRQFARPFSRIRSWIAVKGGDLRADPCNTFDFIMAVSERHGLRSAFNFITAHTGGAIDGDYEPSHPWMLDLMRRIHARGHEIGLHGSYNTYQDSSQTAREFETLRTLCEGEGIRQSLWGGRQHYLRWSPLTTPQNWDAAEIDYDSTLTFADVAGFRCGVCYEYPMFDLANRKAMRLRERPLIVMDRTITSPDYMGLGLGEGALRAVSEYKDRCRLFHGDFTVLWHNSALAIREERDIYEKILAA